MATIDERRNGLPKQVKTTLNRRQLTFMVKDLRQMQKELLPMADAKERQEEMKYFDDYQKTKYKLNILLSELREDIDRLVSLRRKYGDGHRDATMIRLQSENLQKIQTAAGLWNKLNKIRDEQRATIGTPDATITEDELRERILQCTLLGKEITIFYNKNNRFKSATDLDNKSDAADDKKSRGKSKRGSVMDGLRASAVVDSKDISLKEKQFYEQCDRNYQQEEQLLGVIEKGLVELAELSHMMKNGLRAQKTFLQEMESTIEKTTDDIVTANAQLQSLLDESGGISRWCPMLVCIILLMALIGYMVNVMG